MTPPSKWLPPETEDRFPRGPQNFAYQEGQRDKGREFHGCRRWVRVRAEEHRSELGLARHRAEIDPDPTERALASDRGEVLQALAEECDEIAEAMGAYWLGPEESSAG